MSRFDREPSQVQKLSLLMSVLIAFTSPAFAQQAVAPSVQGLPQGTTSIAITFMLAVAVLKLTAFVLGYLIVRLGHDTLIKGVSGAIDFGFKGGAVSAKLKSGSPGAFFVLAGGAIIAWGLFVQKPMEINFTPVQPQQATAVTTTAAENQRLAVPD
jgi:hypothetical protein